MDGKSVRNQLCEFHWLEISGHSRFFMAQIFRSVRAIQSRLQKPVKKSKRKNHKKIRISIRKLWNGSGFIVKSMEFQRPAKVRNFMNFGLSTLFLQILTNFKKVHTLQKNWKQKLPNLKTNPAKSPKSFVINNLYLQKVLLWATGKLWHIPRNALAIAVCELWCTWDNSPEKRQFKSGGYWLENARNN